MPKILFVSYGGGHAAMLRPVAEQAMRAGHEVQFIALTTARFALRDSNIPTLGFNDLWQFGAPGARRFGEELTADLAANSLVGAEESIAYLGMSFAELVADYGYDQAKIIFERDGRQAFLPVNLFKRLLGHLKPDVVVATNSPRSEQAALLASRELGIRSVCVVDLFALQAIKWCGQPGYGSRVCVLSPSVKRLFLQHGRRDDEIVVTGNPAFDKLSSAEVMQRGKALRRQWDWAVGKTIILWASTAEPAIHPFSGETGNPLLPRLVEEQLRKFVRAQNGYALVVRHHPSEQEIFVDEPFVKLSTQNEPLEELLHAVDLVVVTVSTVGLQAALAGRPVISIDLSVCTPDMRYAEFGIAEGLDTIEDVGLAIFALTGKSAGVSRNDGGLLTADGEAAGRVLNVIESLLPDGA